VLDRLLNVLAEGGVYTPTQLASRLGVSEGLVEQMLADLSRMGYLRSVSNPTCQIGSNGHTTPCANCPTVGTCAVGRPGGQVWALTDKVSRRVRPGSQ
jgi:hypothetical protein